MHEPSFLVIAILFLASAVIFVPVASRLKLGSVLGYLIAGCVIGPFGFGFVRNVETILHFAEIGVVLMLFVIGLELEPSRLLAMRSQVFRGGAIQMLAVGIPLFLFLAVTGLPPRGASVAAAALALSSTAIAVQSMKERGVLDSRTGRAAFGVLLFQDIAAIPIVGVVPLLATTTGSSSGVSFVSIAKIVIAIVVVVFLGRVALRPLLRLIANTELRDIFTAFSLLLVLGIAQVMDLAGVSMALGAFLAGVLLAGSEYRHALETDIEPFKGLLMGLFFMGVGMSVDFGLFAGKPLLVLGLVLGFTVIKGTALALIASPLGIGSRDRFAFSALLAQGGEFAFVVFGVARTARILPGDWDRLLTLVVALSMALTPLLLLVVDAIARRQTETAREADVIEADDAPVIIAGFGRFGQIVARLLFASGHKATVLDFDPDQVDLLRRFDFRVFYGDASRLDLLESAGAKTAKVLVVAVDEVETSVRLVEVARQHFPKLAIVARARNVTHYLKLRSLGVEVVERELFEGSLRLGRSVLEHLGVGRYEARERADRFRLENVSTLERTFREPMDQAERIAFSREAREQLERQMKEDMRRLERDHGHGWHPDTDTEDGARAE